MFASINSVGYEIMLFVHVIAAVASMAPSLVVVLQARMGGDVGALIRSNRAMVVIVQSSGLLVSFITGCGLVGLSEDVWNFADLWIVGSLVLWLVAGAALHAGASKASKRFIVGNESALAVAIRAHSLYLGLVVVIVALMTLKPGA